MIRFFTLLVFAVLSCQCTGSAPVTAPQDAPSWECARVIIGQVYFKELDGCTWVIETEDGQIFEPLNLGSFLTADQLNPQRVFRIEFDYEEEPAASICMVGPTIALKCFKVLE